MREERESCSSCGLKQPAFIVWPSKPSFLGELADLGQAHKKAVVFQKFEHVLIEQPRLFDLAGVASPVNDLQLASGNPLLQCERARMGIVLTSGDDDHRTAD